MLLDHYTLRPDEMLTVLNRLEEENEQNQRKNTIAGVSAAVTLVAGLAGLAVFGGFGPDFLIPFGMFGLLFGGVAVWHFFSTRGKKLRQQEDKIGFLINFLDVYEIDLHPSAKIDFDLDLRAYDKGSGKLVWSGRSPHGNPKHRYQDRWLRLKTRLADRTRMVVARRTDVKTKKGSVMKQKEKLFIKLRPDPQIYDLPAARDALRRAVPLLEIRSAGQGEELRLKVAHLGQKMTINAARRDVQQIYSVLGRYRRGR